MIRQNDGVEGIWLMVTPITAEIHDETGNVTHIWDHLPTTTDAGELERWATECGFRPAGPWQPLSLEHFGDLIGSGLPLEAAI
jgi:hypothetical protein